MLEEKLRELAQSNRYPFHMPGHKRMLDGTNPYAIDITEIEDFDNLHHAEGIIKDAEDAAAKMYAAKKAYYLVNGSTVCTDFSYDYHGEHPSGFTGEKVSGNQRKRNLISYIFPGKPDQPGPV